MKPQTQSTFWANKFMATARQLVSCQHWCFNKNFIHIFALKEDDLCQTFFQLRKMRKYLCRSIICVHKTCALSIPLCDEIVQNSEFFHFVCLKRLKNWNFKQCDRKTSRRLVQKVAWTPFGANFNADRPSA